MTKLELAMDAVKESISRYKTDMWDVDYLEETLERLQAVLADHIEDAKEDTCYEYGKLTITETKRWAIKDYELTCGSVFYVFYLGRWVRLQMEAASGEYYTIPNVPLKENMKARVKK